MDDIDERILHLLRANGRRSNRDIARELDVSEKLVANRIRLMLASGEAKIIAVADLFAAGFDSILWIGVVVAGRAVTAVAQDLAEFPEVLSVIVTTGTYDLEIAVVAENHLLLSEFVLSRLSRVAGIRQHSLSLGLRVFKYSTRVGPITPKQRRPLSLPHNPTIDAVDRGIIERVWADARATNQSIAERLSLSEASVRARINGLIRKDILRITCMRSVRVDERHVFAFLGLEVGGADIVDVAQQLARSPTTGFVGIVLGRYQIFATMLVSSTAELADFIADQVEPLRGVRKVHLAHAVKFLKYDDRWTLIVPGEPPAEFPGRETG